MSEPAPPLTPRSADDVRRDLRAAAERSRLPVPDGLSPTWSSLLFADDEWADPAEPTQALLEAATELHAGLAEHLATVPARLRSAWLRDRLGIEPRPGVADRVVVAATADPTRTPVPVAAEAPVRAKDALGEERRYVTSETVTVHGTEVIDVLAHGAEVVAGDAVRDTAARWEDRSVPFEPFGDHAPAAHRFFVLSDLLAFPEGEMDVRLTFSGNVDAKALENAEWEFPPAGDDWSVTRMDLTAERIELRLVGGCTAAEVLGTRSPYLCASLPEGARTPEALAFAPERVEVEVVNRENVRPDAAFANDGRLDPTKEMEPFGPTPRRGDAFYLRSDEAFGKPLAWLGVVLTLLDTDAAALNSVPWSSIPQTAHSSARDELERAAEEFSPKARQFIEDAIIGSFQAKADPRIEWQRYDGTGWVRLDDTGDELKTLTWESDVPATSPHSSPIELGGKGHFVRAFLAEGDFGWSSYERGVAEFAAKAAAQDTPDPAELIAPDPPILSTVSVEYGTHAVAPTAIVSVDGWTTRHPAKTGPHKLFAIPFELAGDRGGMIAIGLRLGEAALGKSVSLYFDVASAPACGSAAESPLRWEHWTEGFGWRRLDVADGTLGLRQPGLLRFVAPLDWPEGADGASATEGRWIRAVTPDPTTVGAILSIVPDAVEALHETGRDAPATAFDPLAPKQVKGLLAAAPGVKKLTNPIAGRPGRPAEDEEDPAYLERAARAVRHRWRAATAWDCEELIGAAFPEVAAIRCLPHTGSDGEMEPGSIGAVVVPATTDRMPLPSISLAERIRAELAPSLPVHAQLAVLCPLYVAVTVDAEIVLAQGVSAVDARTRITAALERLLHPTASVPVRLGQELFASNVVAWLESQPGVDHVEAFELSADGIAVERVSVDACRGAYASGGNHALTFREAL